MTADQLAGGSIPAAGAGPFPPGPAGTALLTDHYELTMLRAALGSNIGQLGDDE